jgi:hypothetical protein
MSVRDVVQAAAGVGGGGDNLYVEDVFSTYLYTGNNSTQTINNGIDLDGEGGLVWIKNRDSAANHALFDTERGAGKGLESSTAAAETTSPSGDLNGFNSNGFSLGSNFAQNVNTSSADYASWTFRKAPKFFDVVTYTGNFTAGREIAHNLGSVPGMIIIKSLTDDGYSWRVYHQSLGPTKFLALNSTNEEGDAVSTNMWNSTAPTDSVFTLGNHITVNSSSPSTYVAYLFAHDAGGFGDDGQQNVISCGSYTGNGSATGPVIDLGYEPQWLLVKQTGDGGGSGSNRWYLFDNMRNMLVGGADSYLSPNSSAAELSFEFLSPTATGFQITNSGSGTNYNGDTYIYIAIRRGPMKTPESGTEVFAVDYGGNSPLSFVSGFPVDMAILARTGSTYPKFNWGRLFGDRLDTSSTDAQATGSSAFPLDSNTQTGNGWGAADIAWMFKRAPGFFDVVAYTGTGVARTVAHNLGVAPEMMIVKNRNASAGNGAWTVYDSINGATKVMFLNATDASSASSIFWNDTEPTSTVFTVGSNDYVNYTNDNYIAYLFASLDGVSKIGSVTISSSGTLNVDCGFANGARFVMLKRSSAGGSWYVFDTARGIVAGNDPYLAFDKTNAEDFYGAGDIIDPYSAGFSIISAGLSNLEGTGIWIYLAIA